MKLAIREASYARRELRPADAAQSLLIQQQYCAAMHPYELPPLKVAEEPADCLARGSDRLADRFLRHVQRKAEALGCAVAVEVGPHQEQLRHLCARVGRQRQHASLRPSGVQLQAEMLSDTQRRLIVAVQKIHKLRAPNHADLRRLQGLS